ncbi:10056_t:CDS:2 [Rhizophagus irregularis]|nr:10056_t:CDS:2 [Rhizophagus irregularis]
MSPPNSFDEKPVVVKSKRGRKALAVSEGHIDVTGRTHIMTVRRTNPPTPKKKTTTPKAIKQNNTYCRRYLLNLSSQINVVLLERFDIQNQLQLQTSMINPITPITPITPINLTPPVSPFTTCEATEITEWSYPPFNQY